MTSSWSEPGVVSRAVAMTVTPAEQFEIRTGSWGRLGEGFAGSDGATERALTDLAERAQAAGRAQGYASGWAEGRRAADLRARQESAAATEAVAEAERRRDEEHASAVAALLLAADRLHHAVAQACAVVEADAVELAFRLVEEIVGRELEVARDPGADAVRRALALLPEGPVATVRLHPDDLAGARSACREGARLVADPSLLRGDAIVETEGGIIDARISTALARVRKAWR